MQCAYATCTGLARQLCEEDEPVCHCFSYVVKWASNVGIRMP
jgi:hypothetical protein